MRTRKKRDWESGEWPSLASDYWLRIEIKKHGNRFIFPDWSQLAEQATRKAKQRGNYVGRWRQEFIVGWMAHEIRAHAKRSIYPDWGILADRYLDNKKRNHKECYSRRRTKELKSKKEYRQRPEVKAAAAKRMREKCASDPGFRIKKRLSRRLCEIMSGDKKGMSVLQFIGCSQYELKTHIESQFKRWMNWGNYGTKWHIDHIIPCAAFDHTDLNQVAACWHWTNLRPLCAKENSAKKDRITLPQMKLRLELCA